MRSTRRLLSLGVASTLVATGLFAAWGSAAEAASAVTPPYEPDSNAVGTLSFYDASGNQILNGNINDAPFATYVQASAAGGTGDTKATLFGALPINGVASGNWTSEIISGSTNYPNASAPSALASSPLPLVTLHAADETIATLASDLPNTATDSYQGLYQLRLFTSPNGNANGEYDVADIQVTGSTWQEVYPQASTVTPPTATSVTETVSPVSPAYHGIKVTMTAHATPGVPGIADFYDGTTLLAHPAVSTAGVATFADGILIDGTHHFHVAFVPTDTVSYSASTSATLTYVVRVRPTTLTIKESVTKSHYGTYVTFTTVVSPSAAGTVRFYSNGSLFAVHAITSSYAVRVKTLKIGTHKIQAIFTPTVAASFTKSYSKVIVLTVIK